MRILLTLIATLSFVCVGTAWPAQTTQPTAKQVKKIWYNDDVERLRPDWRPEPLPPGIAQERQAERPKLAPASAEAETKVEEEATVEPGVAPKPPDRRNQADYWQKQLAPLQAELAQVESQISGIQRARVTGEGMSNGVNLLDHASRLSPENQVQLLEQRRAELLRKISELEDEARRMSVPPGWLR